MAVRIGVNPQIHFGKPCVAGTRITVQSVLELVREGVSFADIIRDHYPDLQPEDVRACIQYAIDVLAVVAPSAIRDHSAFLRSYGPEDEGLYDDCAAG